MALGTRSGPARWALRVPLPGGSSLSAQVWTLILGPLAVIMGPLFLAHLLNRQRVNEKKLDWARQDEVAARAADVAEAQRLRAEEVANQAAEAAKLLLASNERVAAQGTVAEAKLTVIQRMVDGQMTSALQGELAARQEALAMMQELAAIRAKNGDGPSPESVMAIEEAKRLIDVLEHTLAERARLEAEDP